MKNERNSVHRAIKRVIIIQESGGRPRVASSNALHSYRVTGGRVFKWLSLVQQIHGQSMRERNPLVHLYSKSIYYMEHVELRRCRRFLHALLSTDTQIVLVGISVCTNVIQNEQTWPSWNFHLVQCAEHNHWLVYPCSNMYKAMQTYQ